MFCKKHVMLIETIKMSYKKTNNTFFKTSYEMEQREYLPFKPKPKPIKAYIISCGCFSILCLHSNESNYSGKNISMLLSDAVVYFQS